MPRTPRASLGNICYHVCNRGNGRAVVFHKHADYDAFIDMIAGIHDRLDMRVLGWCLMPNHFHLVLWPRDDGDLGRWMQMLLTTHVRRYHRHYHSSGHVWQGRYKSFPIQQDEHLLTVLRYVERNPLRAKLVRAAQRWRWSSLHCLDPRDRPAFWHAGPVDRPRNWIARVNRPETAAELAAVRRSVIRGRPFGSESWTLRTAARLGLESTIRPRGRPRKTPAK